MKKYIYEFDLFSIDEFSSRYDKCIEGIKSKNKFVLHYQYHTMQISDNVCITIDSSRSSGEVILEYYYDEKHLNMEVSLNYMFKNNKWYVYGVNFAKICYNFNESLCYLVCVVYAVLLYRWIYMNIGQNTDTYVDIAKVVERIKENGKYKNIDFSKAESEEKNILKQIKEYLLRYAGIILTTQ